MDDPPSNVSHGGVRVEKAKVSAAQEVPADKIVEIARSIWREIRDSDVAADDDAGNDRLLKDLRERYPDFAVSFPVPFRWMVQAREFDAKAFETYLKTRVKGLYKDRKEFLAAQAEYLVLLYRARHPRIGPRQLARYREAVVKSLEEDDEAFVKAQKEAEEEVARLDGEVDKDRRQRVYDYLVREKVRRGGLAVGPPAL